MGKLKVLAVRDKAEEEKERQRRRDELEKYLRKNLKAQVAEQVQQYSTDIVYLFLYVLHDRYNFGRKRLLDVAHDIKPCLDELQEHYKRFYGDEDHNVWLCEAILKNNCGITREELQDILSVGAVVVED